MLNTERAHDVRLATKKNNHHIKMHQLFQARASTGKYGAQGWRNKAATERLGKKYISDGRKLIAKRATRPDGFDLMRKGARMLHAAKCIRLEDGYYTQYYAIRLRVLEWQNGLTHKKKILCRGLRQS